jgi:hypothetical protein
LHFENEGIFLNYSTVNGHAPTETTDDEEKDGFFDFLETAHDISPRNDIKIAHSNLVLRWARKLLIFPPLTNTVYTFSWMTMDPS